MINLRYHIVSITAVFLALGIGAALGGTFLDRYTVDLLDRNIRSAENRIAETEEENSRLAEDLEAADARDDALVQLGSASLLDGRLTDRPVLVVAAPGVDQATLDALDVALSAADADRRGVLAVREEMAFDEEIDEGLVEALDLGDAGPSGVRAVVVARLTEALVAAGAPAAEGEGEAEPGPGGAEPGGGEGGGDATTTLPDEGTSEPQEGEEPGGGDPGTGEPGDDGAEDEEAPTVPDGTQPEVVTALLDAEYLELTPGPGRDASDPILEATGYEYVYVSGPEPTEVDADLLLSLLPEVPEAEAPPVVVVNPTVARSDDEEDAAGPTPVEAVRASPALSRLYDTVDNVETFAGLASTVLLLESVDVAAGHYGEHTGATALMPAGS